MSDSDTRPANGVATPIRVHAASVFLNTYRDAGWRLVDAPAGASHAKPVARMLQAVSRILRFGLLAIVMTISIAAALALSLLAAGLISLHRRPDAASSGAATREPSAASPGPASVVRPRPESAPAAREAPAEPAAGPALGIRA